MGRRQMATCTKPRTGRRTDDRSVSSRPTTITTPEPVVHVTASSAEPAEEDYDVIDYWGYGDSLSCLAAWG
ncbi:MAG: hypothetical protein QOH12_570 [Solirubrobacteraceae bacterium]|nr:hypothetical protein [Solirubrobacteraceae bacterium]